MNNLVTGRAVILGSASPRRKDLLSGLGIEFSVQSKETDESFPDSLSSDSVAEFLAEKKSDKYDAEVSDGALVITADTVVRLDNDIINKPLDESDAIKMLKRLSGRSHIVITGVCLRWNEKKITFSDHTEVSFTAMNDDEIVYYLRNFKPYDKAGSYGIQDWIGLAFIDRIQGSYHNVMGLPTARLYSVLKSTDFR